MAAGQALQRTLALAEAVSNDRKVLVVNSSSLSTCNMVSDHWCSSHSEVQALGLWAGGAASSWLHCDDGGSKVALGVHLQWR